MNKEQIKGNWNQLKGKVKEKYGVAIDDLDTKSEGIKDQVIGKIQKETGKAKEDVKKFIDEL